MLVPRDRIVVKDIAGDIALLYVEDESIGKDLVNLGYKKDGNFFRKPIVDDKDRVRLIEDLTNRGALFSKGRDWSPSELIEYYREIGLVKGTYKTIAWKNPSEYLIEDN